MTSLKLHFTRALLISILGLGLGTLQATATPIPGTALDDVKLQLQEEIHAPANMPEYEETSVQIQFTVNEEGKMDIVSLEGEYDNLLNSIKEQVKDLTVDQAASMQQYLFNFTLRFIQQ